MRSVCSAEPVARALDVDDDRVMEQAGLGGGDAEGDGEMALAGAGRAEEMYHLGAVVEVELAQVDDAVSCPKTAGRRSRSS